MFEHKNQKVISRPRFKRRVTKYTFVAAGIIGVSWVLGAVGYRCFSGSTEPYHAHLDWVSSFYNAAMILGGMGPVDELYSDTAKWFASFYALFSGITFLSATSIFFAPFVHRFLHVLHVDDTDN
ncbi:MAG: hypothetical protein U0X91_13880 [Spirosomataceae bacterium]